MTRAREFSRVLHIVSFSSFIPSDNVGQSECRLPMMITLITLFHYLAFSITIMYISSPFPIDPGSSRQVLQLHLTCDRYPYSLRHLILAAGHPNPLQLFVQPQTK